jgi:hypothetical protein
MIYEFAGSPETSHYALLDIGQANNITTLAATLPGDELSLGGIANGSGGLGNVAASAARITVTGLDTSQAGAGGNVDLRSVGDLTVAPNALLDSGAGTIALAAGVNADGTASSNGGVLFVSSAATVVSDNPGQSAVTLRGTHLGLDTGPDPALVGAHRGTSGTAAPSPASGGVVVRTARSEQPISVGADPGPSAGLSLSSAELARIFTTDSGTITFGDAAQTGNITFAAAPATPGAGVAALQAVGGPGAIVLDGSAGTALAAGSGNVRLSAGAGGIVALGAASSIASTGQVTLDAGGDVGASGHRILFDAGATPTDVWVGIGGHLTEGAVYLGGLGNLTLARTVTANELLDVTAAGNLIVDINALIRTGAGTVALAAGVNPDGTASSTGGVLSLASAATVASSNAGGSAITLRGSDIDIDTGTSPAAVGDKGGPPGGVVVRTARTEQPISVGAATGTGLSLSNAELARILTTATGTITFGDAAQIGAITFADAAPATAPGASVVALQAPTGPGAIVLDGGAGTALTGGSGNIRLSAGTGGIVATGGGASLAGTGQVTLDTLGSVGASDRQVGFAAATPAAVTIGTTSTPRKGVYLGAFGNLTLAGVRTANAPLEVVASNLTVSGALSAGDVSLEARDVTVSAGASVTAGDGNTLTVLANTLGLLGTLSAGSTGVVWLRPDFPNMAIDLGGTGPDTDLVLDDSALGRVTAGTLRIGDAYTIDITVTGNVTGHAGYDTLSLLTDGSIDTATGATLAAANLALRASTGIGTTGALAIDAAHLLFASRSGPVQLSDASTVTLTGIDALLPPTSTIAGDVYTAQKVGAVYTLLHSGGGVSGQISYAGQALAEGDTLTLDDGHRYQISYQGGTSGHDVTLTRLADPTIAPPPPPAEQFVRGLYREVLGRAADEAGLAAWLAFVQAGGAHQQVAQGFWESAEHRGLEVDQFYATYLHRVADAGGRAFWVSALQGGMSESDVAHGFLTSEEYRQTHADINAYLTGLYADVLGRTPDADGLAGWQTAAQAGMSPAALADSFLGSEEAARQAVDQYYANYLSRAGSAAEVSGWVGALQSGLTPEQVAVAFLASDEFYNRDSR